MTAIVTVWAGGLVTLTLVGGLMAGVFADISFHGQAGLASKTVDFLRDAMEHEWTVVTPIVGFYFGATTVTKLIRDRHLSSPE